MGRFRQETKDEDINDYLREAFEIAGRCREDNEQCRDIYENLENEPLYGETEMMHSEARTCGEPENNPDRAAKAVDESDTADSDKKSWWQKLWKK